MPSWSLSEPFCSTSWSMAVYLSSSHFCLTTCCLAVVLSIFGWFDTSHYSCQVQSLQSKIHVWRVDVLVCEDLWYLLKYGCEGNTLLWRSIFYIDKFKSCTLWCRLWFWSSDVSISYFCLSLAISINSSNATSLHSRCIWEGVLRV